MQFQKKAILIMGPPGSGKGTQAELIADKIGVFHFNTGEFLESIWYDPARQKDSLIKREKKLFDTGKLNTPSVVLSLVNQRIKELKRLGKGVVFSGSPRTFFEAFGDNKNVGLIETLKKNYGKKNIYVLLLVVDAKKAIQRNVGRLLCSVCGTQLLSVLNVKLTRCPFCGGRLRKRTLDEPDVMKVRLTEFANRTKPILSELKKRGYKIHKINANLLPYEVFALIERVIR